MTNNKAIVIIPTFNEADNILPLLNKIWKLNCGIHVLVVDDNSMDGTAALVTSEQKRLPEGPLHLLIRAGKLGLGTAYIAGFKWALAHGYDYIIEMDADFSHDPAMLPVFISELTNSPVIVGSRYTKGGATENWSFIRKLISRFGSFYARTILQIPIADLTGGFNGWRSEVLRAIELDKVKSEGYSFQIELKYRAFKKRFAIQEIPILFSERRAGASKMSSKIVVEAIGRVWKLRCEI